MLVALQKYILMRDQSRVRILNYNYHIQGGLTLYEWLYSGLLDLYTTAVLSFGGSSFG